MAHGKQNAVTFYLIIALVLGAITYLEFALVEYDVAWLSTPLIVTLLVVLSLIKFGLVVAIYMHLRDDDVMYSGFFASGMVIALGTFIAVSFLFTVRSAAASIHTNREAPRGEDHAMLESLEAVEARPLLEQFRAPQPKSQRISITLPQAAATNFALADASSVAPIMPAASASTPSQSQGDMAAQGNNNTDADSAADADSADGDMTANFDWQQLGNTTYTQNCASCHQANGQGIPGAFPPLAGHVPNLYNADGGREYIIKVVLYGLQGQISVNGMNYNGVMTAWGQLSDDQIAATLNHELTSWGNDQMLSSFRPIMPDEVAALRGLGLTGQQVHATRPALP
jgi:mono/diheme cytochrome c family protein/cytochrome c oxidase subunit IV